MLLKVQHVRLLFLIIAVMFTMTVPEALGTMLRQTPENLQSLETELSRARENLRISKAGEEKIRIDLDRMKQSSYAPAATIQEYESYHERMKALVRANQKRVNQLEALRQKYSPRKASAEKAKRNAGDTGHNPEIPEESISDPVADLDRQLDQSLAAFDVTLLKEMELIEIQSAEKIKELTDEMEETRKRLKEQGIDIDAADSRESADKSGGQEHKSGAEETEAEPEDRPGADGTMAAGDKRPADTREAETGSVTTGKPKPAKGTGGLTEEEKRRYGSGEDDDIVARQLREAAEKEADPELREKIWKEYEAYKQNL